MRRKIGTVYAGGSVNAGGPLAKCLRAWWPGMMGGGGIMQDMIGGNHATLTSATFAGAMPWLQGWKTVSYNGSLAKVTSKPQISDNFDGGGMFSCWLYVNSWPSSSRLFDKNFCVLLLSGNSGSTVSLELDQFYSTSYRGSASNFPDQYPITFGQWTHVAATYNSDSSANLAQFYINGRAISMTSPTAPSGARTSDAGNDLNFGNEPGLARPLDGKMCDVRFYRGFLPDAAFVKAVMMDSYFQYAGTLNNVTRRHRKKAAAASGNRRRRVICSGGE